MTEPIVPPRPAPAGALLAPVAAGLAGMAARVGQETWWAARLFEVVGRWASSEVDAEAKVVFGRHGAHLAWRADQWHDRLPELRELPRDQVVASPGPHADALVDALGRAPGTVERLVGLYRVVLPRLVTAHRAHLLAATGVADGPVRRTLQLLVPDEVADRDEGEALLQARLVDVATVEAAARQLSALERLLVA